jgi:hypothetical protein
MAGDVKEFPIQEVPSEVLEKMMYAQKQRTGLKDQLINKREFLEAEVQRLTKLIVMIDENPILVEFTDILQVNIGG